MAIVRPTKAYIAKMRRETNWAAIDAMTDEDIARQIAEDPDVAPDQTEFLLAGEFKPAIDVKSVRRRTGLSQSRFAKRYRIPLRTLQDWEQRRSLPDHTAVTYLRVIEKDPEAVRKILER
jgi:putative transcriptional regulator